MSLLLYNLFLLLYRAGINIYALFNGKAAKWIKGRSNWRAQLGALVKAGEQRIWIHCASAGEFEQGRPVIDALKKNHPDKKILLSFFSPSGYEIRREYANADYVCYLPLDGKKNAKDFIAIVNPSLAIFVKYEFWYYFLEELHSRKIRTIVIAAAFRRGQPFFEWYGKLFRSLLDCFDWIFVQDSNSKDLLAGIGFSANVSVCGDTRFDRVGEIAAARKAIPVAEQFRGTEHLLIAGSTWPHDEKLLANYFDVMPPNWKIIIAPHEIDRHRIDDLLRLFGNNATLFSAADNGRSEQGKRVLVVDNMGMLSSLYAYGQIAYVGGGFEKGGIHNVLEPAVFGLPVIFGPLFRKFVEAQELVEAGYAFSVNDQHAFNAIIKSLIERTSANKLLADSISNFIAAKSGATNLIVETIETKGWLGDRVLEDG